MADGDFVSRIGKQLTGNDGNQIFFWYYLVVEAVYIGFAQSNEIGYRSVVSLSVITFFLTEYSHFELLSALLKILSHFVLVYFVISKFFS